MLVEIPEFKRCLCCIPLRYGLLGWTYIRMVYLLPLIFVISKSLHDMVIRDNPFQRTIFDITIQCIYLVLLVLDVVFNIVFLVGGHMKNQKLLKVQYYYNMVSLVLFALLVTANILYVLYMYYQLNLIYELGFTLMISLCYPIAGIVIQVYVILLTRSEIRKLANIVEFWWFENRAAGAQCTVNIADYPRTTNANDK